MNALVAGKAKVQPALRVRNSAELRVTLAQSHEPQGQERGDLATALCGRHAVGRGLFDDLHWKPFDYSNLYPESNYGLGGGG